MELTNGTEKITFGSDGFELERLTLSPYDIKSSFVTGYGSYGTMCTQSCLLSREVKIEGYIKGEDIESKRRLLGRICDPVAEFSLLDGSYFLSLCLKRGIELSSEKRFTDKLLRFTVYAVAPYPLWQGGTISKTIYNVAASSAVNKPISVENPGDVPVGYKMRILFMLDTEYFRFTMGDKRMSMTYSFKTGDVLIIDTRYGQKSAILTPYESEDKLSLMGYFSVDSDFFPLQSGENTVDYFIQNGAMYITYTFVPAYLR